MSAEKKYTEREMVLARRAAWKDGFVSLNECPCNAPYACPTCNKVGEEYAAAIYPLPRVTRPRVVADPDPGFDQEWKCDGGELWWRMPGREWKGLRDGGSRAGTITEVTAERIAVWADLLANPTEEVDDV